GAIARSEFQLALEAILKACADAGVDPKEVDGFASYSMDRNEPVALARSLGARQLRFASMMWGGGGGGGSGAVGQAAMAIFSGTANYVIAFRALAQGQFGRFGQSRAGGGMRVPGQMGFNNPFGLLSAA